MHTDFNTFCKTHTDVHTTICHVSKSVWTQEGHIYAYDITANRFLRGMIRLVVGMCLNVERKKLTLEEVHTALKNKQRTGHDWSVPPKGLTLHSIQTA